MSEEQVIASREELEAGVLVAGRYKIIRPLGKGGMGVVYLATDEVLKGETVAIKILHREFAFDETHTKRFLREVQLMRRVNNPNVIRTFDVGADNELVYFTMEYVEAKPLDYFIDEADFPSEQIIPLLLQVCDGLEAIHEAGIVHRDLKPSNILVLEDGSSRIMDFGVARPQSSELTAHNEIVGSATYVAPEIWLGKSPTPLIDLYSLGIILYELTTGDVPFDADSPAALMRLHLDREVVAPKEINREVPAWLNRLILRLLAKSPKDRPADAGEIIEYVTNYLDRGFHVPSASAGGMNAPCVTHGFLDSLENYSNYLVSNAESSAAPELPSKESASKEKRSFGWLGIGKKLREHMLILSPKLRGWSKSLSVNLTFSFASTIFIVALAWLGYEVSNLYSLSRGAEVDLTFILLNGLPKAIAGALFLSLPLVILASFSRSILQVIKALSISFTYNLLVGAFLTIKLLDPILSRGEILPQSLLTAGSAAAEQLVHLILMCPLIASFESITVQNSFQLFSEPHKLIWEDFSLLACSLIYVLIVFSTLKGLSSVSKLVISCLFLSFLCISSLVGIYLVDTAELHMLTIFQVNFPHSALVGALISWAFILGSALMLGALAFGKKELSK